MQPGRRGEGSRKEGGEREGERERGREKDRYVYLVGLHCFEAAAEILKSASLFVHLHSFSIILDLSIHTTGALSHRHANGTTGFSLKQGLRYIMDFCLTPTLSM